MNKKMIVYILGKMLGTEGLLLLIPAVVSLLYKEKTGVYFLVVAAVLFALYLGLGRKKPENKQIYGKEGFVIVGLAWILWSLFEIFFRNNSNIPPLRSSPPTQL